MSFISLLVLVFSGACQGSQATNSPQPTNTLIPSLTFSPSPSFTSTPTATLTITPSPSATASPTPSRTPPATLTLRPVNTPIKIYPSCQPVETDFNPYDFPTPPPATPIIPSLRSLASSQGLWIGTAADGGYLFERQYADLIRSQFNLLTPENAMKWERIHPEKDVFDFREADALVHFAEMNNMAFYGHGLVWHLQLPEWVQNGRFTRKQWINILCTHVKTIVHHYRGRILVWNVVNEAMGNDGVLNTNIWFEKIGPEYIDMAFQWAYEADPGAILAYNDFGAEALNVKSQAVYDLAQDLIKKGVPLQAVGLQMHAGIGFKLSLAELKSNIQRLAQLGLQVHITEMDIRLYPQKGDLAKKLALQAQVYRDVLAICLDQPNCRIFTTWGASDLHTWIPGITGNPDYPLIFDQEGQPKPAYYALIDLLNQP